MAVRGKGAGPLGGMERLAPVALLAAGQNGAGDLKPSACFTSSVIYLLLLILTNFGGNKALEGGSREMSVAVLALSNGSGVRLDFSQS